MSSDVIISVENLSKKYRLGQIGATTLRESAERLWHRLRGRDPAEHMGVVGCGAGNVGSGKSNVGSGRDGVESERESSSAASAVPSTSHVSPPTSSSSPVPLPNVSCGGVDDIALA